MEKEIYELKKIIHAERTRYFEAMKKDNERYATKRLYAHIKELEKKLKLLEDKNKDGMDGKQIK